MDQHKTPTAREMLEWLTANFTIARAGYGGYYDPHPGEVWRAFLMERESGRSFLHHMDAVVCPAHEGWGVGEFEALSEVLSGNNPLGLEVTDQVIERFLHRKAEIEAGLLKLQRRRQASAVTANKETRDRIFARDGEKCAECGREDDLTLDHIIAVINGGSDEDDNLRVLCRSCNSRKGAS